MILLIKLYIILVSSLFYAICIQPGPKYPPTKGEIWPKPQNQVKYDTYYVFESFDKTFYITKPYFTCDILEEDELFVSDKVVLSSASIWGILRGMETFNHLLYYSDDYTEIRFNTTSIEDYPAYKHRGLLIDTGRHYLKPETINLLIDAMEMNKMNVLHWHIVDDQSFPYQSERFPSLSKKGAYHSSMVYTKEIIQQIVERGRLAGIRVIPEFDVPGHVRSWGEAYPSILTRCYKSNTNVETGLGPLNPINNATYLFLKYLYKEVAELFPDEYIHLGGDEVDTTCWQSNPEIQDYMKKNQLNDINILQTQFMGEVNRLLPSRSKPILWQEVFDSGVTVSPQTIFQVWKYDWVNEMTNILKAGKRVIFSSMWYLDAINNGWEIFYDQDPRWMVFIKTFNKSGLEDIIGGEACMWGEMVDDNNIFSRVWPRTSAIAERLWCGAEYKMAMPFVTDFTRRRIEEHTCRMRQNGISAEPANGPGFCLGPASRYEVVKRTTSRRNKKRNSHYHFRSNTRA